MGSVLQRPESEKPVNHRSEPERQPARTNGRSSRGGPGWFSYDLPIDGGHPAALVVTYFNEQGMPPTFGNFEILVAGTSIAKFEPNANATGFYYATYAVPRTTSDGKNKLTVKFQAAANGRVAPVFGVRTIRVD